MPDETPNEKHNRIGVEIASQIATEFDAIGRLVVLESVIAAVVGTIKFKPEVRETAIAASLDTIFKGAKQRIKERSS